MTLARLAVMPFNDFVSFGKAKVGVARRHAKRSGVALDGLDYHVGDGWLLEVDRTVTSLIQ